MLIVPVFPVIRNPCRMSNHYRDPDPADGAWIGPRA
jgi:hypothetical protein